MPVALKWNSSSAAALNHSLLCPIWNDTIVSGREGTTPHLDPISSRLLRPHVDQWLGHSVNDKLQPCVYDLSHSLCVSPSRSQFNSILFGTEEVERDTKSLDFGQQHTRIKDNMITQLSLGTAIGHFIMGGDSNNWGAQTPRDGSLAFSSGSLID